ncbi:uncharacterized protein N7500_007664 [Penicillium coprophilum]|uniref:uncharacterized protein n=1 Tax=Penicillium coprophilum TaxID=36646 RepID=UPI0023A08E0A|nr:uncharacterized protein N7500_007664 [Penicillium coprophilum]KAJ5158013.1 hypothetical protein N7500_007664 [Penicillium coprophilum]
MALGENTVTTYKVLLYGRPYPMAYPYLNTDFKNQWEMGTVKVKRTSQVPCGRFMLATEKTAIIIAI